MKYEEAFANLLNDLWTEGQKLPVENIHAHDEYSEWADCKNCNPCYEEDK